MPYLYERIILVNVAGFEIQHLRMRFDINVQPDETPRNCMLWVYNLADREERQVFERNSPVLIRAGYPSRLGIVFEGKISRIVRQRTGQERSIQLQLIGEPWGAGGGEAPPITGRSYNGSESVRNIVTDIVCRDMNMPVGDMSMIPADAMVDNFHTVMNSTAALTRVTSRVGVSWYEDNGVVRFNAPGSYRSDTTRLRIAPDTGLLKGTAYTDDGDEESGYRVRTLLNPLVTSGALVDLESKEVKGGVGVFKITSFRHEGDNWEGPFNTEYDLVEIENPPPRSATVPIATVTIGEGTTTLVGPMLSDEELADGRPPTRKPVASDPQPMQIVRDVYKPGDMVPDGSPGTLSRVTYFSNLRRFRNGNLVSEGPTYVVRHELGSGKSSDYYTTESLPSWASDLEVSE